MSKEQTPIEEANKWFEKIDVKTWLQTIITDVNPKACLAEVLADFGEQLLTKEKEHREELIKETYADALINLTMFEEGKISKEEMEMIYKRAEQYYNEVKKKTYRYEERSKGAWVEQRAR